MSCFEINSHVNIPWRCIHIHAIRAQGAGGQNVNKVSSAICLQVDLKSTPLPETVRQKLYAMSDHRITADYVINIKAQNHRSQQLNREEALERLKQLIGKACLRDKKRLKTRPSRGSIERRIQKKTQRGSLKKLRGKPTHSD